MKYPQEEIKQIEYMMELVKKCMKLHLSHGNHKKAKLCIADIYYLEKKLRQAKNRNKTRKINLEVTPSEKKRNK